MGVTVEENMNAIKSMKSGKAPDHHGISSENLKYCDRHVVIQTSILFSEMFKHGYIPNGVMLSTLVKQVNKLY